MSTVSKGLAGNKNFPEISLPQYKMKFNVSEGNVPKNLVQGDTILSLEKYSMVGCYSFPLLKEETWKQCKLITRPSTSQKLNVAWYIHDSITIDKVVFIVTDLEK